MYKLHDNINYVNKLILILDPGADPGGSEGGHQLHGRGHLPGHRQAAAGLRPPPPQGAGQARGHRRQLRRTLPAESDRQQEGTTLRCAVLDLGLFLSVVDLDLGRSVECNNELCPRFMTVSKCRCP